MEAERVRIETEPDRLRAEAELIAAKKSHPPMGSPRGAKRRLDPANAPVMDDLSIAQLSSQYWHNMQCLSHAAWVGRPLGCSDDLRTVFAAVLRNVKNHPFHSGYRPRMLPGTIDVIAVYVNLIFDVGAWAASYWISCHATNNPASLVPPSEVTQVPSSSEAPAEMQPLNVRQSSKPVPQRKDGAFDLGFAILGDPVTMDASKRKELIRCLDTCFVQANDHWGVLWPHRGKDSSIIWTFLDVTENKGLACQRKPIFKPDPIIPQLRAWLMGSEDPRSVDPPMYPALNDLRPVETVPPELSAMEEEHSLLTVSKVCIQRCNLLCFWSSGNYQNDSRYIAGFQSRIPFLFLLCENCILMRAFQKTRFNYGGSVQ